MSTISHSEVRDFYKENFYDKNETVYNIEYVDTVYDNLKEELDDMYSDNILLVTAYCHGLHLSGSNINKNQVLSSKYVSDISDKYVNTLTDDDIKLVTSAIRYYGDYNITRQTSPLHRGLAHAVKGVPEISKYVKRIYAFIVNTIDAKMFVDFKNKLEEDDIDTTGNSELSFNVVYLHMIETILMANYSRSSNFADSKYKAIHDGVLKRFWVDVDNIDILGINKILDKSGPVKGIK